MKSHGFIIEISLCGSVQCCTNDGDEISGQLLSDVQDCSKSGDNEDACTYVLEKYNPDIRIVRKVNGEYTNVQASIEEKCTVCEQIYFESDTDFKDEDSANLYIMWELANSEDIESKCTGV